MLVIKAWHIIAMVAWFAGLFYLPRLFVYHTQTYDSLSLERFCIMEWRLYYAIMWPAAMITTVLGFSLLWSGWPYYRTAGWMHMKLALVAVLWIYHVLCGYYVRVFARGHYPHTTRYFRFFNEVPTILLIAIVMLVVVHR